MKLVLRIFLFLGTACTTHLAGNVCSIIPSTFQGAGATVLGQTTDAIGNPIDTNKSLAVLATEAYNVANGCPIFTYNQGAFEQDSTAGIQQTAAGTILFGGTVAPVDSTLLCPIGPLIEWPVALCGLVFFYNLPNQSVPLRFTPQDVADLFSGQFTTWSALNTADNIGFITSQPSDLNLPIRIVIRSDSAGTTGLLNQFLEGNVNWALDGNGPFSTAQWRKAFQSKPMGINSLYSSLPSVSTAISYVMKTPGAVCYVGYNNVLAAGALKFAPSNQIRAINLAQVGTNTVKPVDPNPANFTNGTYPITQPASLITRACQFSQDQVIQLRKFLYFFITYAQEVGESLGFGTLSQDIVNTFIAQLDRLSYLEDCTDIRVPSLSCSTNCTPCSILNTNQVPTVKVS